jgi:uncharacterized SAM-binding protein YcdF (DUF218 family)
MRALAVGLSLVLVAVVCFPASLLIFPLEARFPVCRKMPDQRVDGIVVLGGFHLDGRVLREWSDIPHGTSERILETVSLSRLYPEARVLYSGAGGEATIVREVFVRLGIPSEAIIIEDQARNTAENAKFSKEIAAPRPWETWLLVTSAHHMPRAIGAFRSVEFPVEACPVEFLNERSDVGELDYVKLALKEYIGLLVYWISGQSKELLPSPGGGAKGRLYRSLAGAWALDTAGPYLVGASSPCAKVVPLTARKSIIPDSIGGASTAQ